MFKFMLGYFYIGVVFLIFHFFYNILFKRNSHDNLIKTTKKDFENIYVYAKQIILSHSKIFKIILVLMVILFFLSMLPYQTGTFGTLDIVECSLSVITFFFLVIIFAPQENPSFKGFPIEIFGFIYSIIFMFYSSGSLVVVIFYIDNFFKEDVWIYGYIVTVISYVVCIATLRRFMERDLRKEEIVLLGMIMMTTLEFITYYGIGFFCGLAEYDPLEYESSTFGSITKIINQGIYIASQSQILERSSMEIWGYIILNGTDALTITAVLGYLLQKIMGSNF